MRKIKVIITAIFLGVLNYSYSQEIDSSSIKFNSKSFVFMDYCTQNVHTKEEVECFINSKDESISVKYLQKENFDNYIFVLCEIELNQKTNKTNSQKKCTYRINASNNKYILAFDIKHKKAYKLTGGCNSSDFKQFYSDYLYLENEVEVGGKGKQKKSFIKTHKIENLDLKELWEKYIE